MFSQKKIEGVMSFDHSLQKHFNTNIISILGLLHYVKMFIQIYRLHDFYLLHNADILKCGKGL